MNRRASQLTVPPVGGSAIAAAADGAPCRQSGGGSTAVEELYRLHAVSVFRWVQRLGGPDFDVEDAVQEVFAIVQERLGSFRGESQFRTWLFGIARRVVHRQRAARRRREVPSGSAHDVAGHLASADRPALDRIADDDLSRLVYRVFDRMNPRYRDALILFELEGMSGDEIAELRGLRPATVWVVLHRARRQFVQEFQAVTGRQP